VSVNPIEPWWAVNAGKPWDDPPHTRRVPAFSGEGAIYSPEYLARKEGNSKGSDPEFWRFGVN
jgi:hypothetical protein